MYGQPLSLHAALPISDSGDNPTAGGAGDVTWTLARILADEGLRTSGKRLVYASIPDAAAADALAAAGPGAHVDVAVGARVDDRLHGPVRLVGEVVSVPRSDERRVGDECVRTCGSRGSPYPSKKNNDHYSFKI